MNNKNEELRNRIKDQLLEIEGMKQEIQSSITKRAE